VAISLSYFEDVSLNAVNDSIEARESRGWMMNASQRIVTEFPLTELWNSLGPVPYQRANHLGADEIADMLRQGKVQFIVADCGYLLDWISMDRCFQFWKSEVKPRLVEPEVADKGFRLQGYPGEYCYVASRWVGDDAEPVVLLEKAH
jgi:hypothetical protein